MLRGVPEMEESVSFGHPWFRAGGKMITVFGGKPGAWTVNAKCGKPEMSLFLADTRFHKTEYIGNHGWVTLTLPAKKPNWEEVAELLRMSYRNNAPKKLLKKL